MKTAEVVLVVGLVVAAWAFTPGCESDSPGSHTLSLAGANHLEGHTAPLVNCVECHGASLNGGEGPSCYECHDNGDHTTVRGGRRHRTGGADSCQACHGPGNGGGLGPACTLCH